MGNRIFYYFVDGRIGIAIKTDWDWAEEVLEFALIFICMKTRFLSENPSYPHNPDVTLKIHFFCSHLLQTSGVRAFNVTTISGGEINGLFLLLHVLPINLPIGDRGKTSREDDEINNLPRRTIDVSQTSTLLLPVVTVYIVM